MYPSSRSVSPHPRWVDQGKRHYINCYFEYERVEDLRTSYLRRALIPLTTGVTREELHRVMTYTPLTSFYLPGTFFGDKQRDKQSEGLEGRPNEKKGKRRNRQEMEYHTPHVYRPTPNHSREVKSSSTPCQLYDWWKESRETQHISRATVWRRIKTCNNFRFLNSKPLLPVSRSTVSLVTLLCVFTHSTFPVTWTLLTHGQERDGTWMDTLTSTLQNGYPESKSNVLLSLLIYGFKDSNTVNT